MVSAGCPLGWMPELYSVHLRYYYIFQQDSVRHRHHHQPDRAGPVAPFAAENGKRIGKIREEKGGKGRGGGFRHFAICN
jgi:hypothetical protein